MDVFGMSVRRLEYPGEHTRNFIRDEVVDGTTLTGWRAYNEHGPVIVELLYEEVETAVRRYAEAGNLDEEGLREIQEWFEALFNGTGETYLQVAV